MQEDGKITRASNPVLDEILGKPIKVLDKGFIRLIDYMGDDASIVQAARVSYGKGTKQVNEDRGLIRYLMRHHHTTPFEMCEVKFHIKLPIFIARQWIRHRTANVNEYSARYSVLSKEFYLPEQENIATQSQHNKQGRNSSPSQQASNIRHQIEQTSNQAYKIYENLLEGDLARELARMSLPLNYYTQWYWKIDLHNLFHFIKLREDSHAQWEIREYAKALSNIVEKWVPHAYQAFCDYKQNGVHLSAAGLKYVKAKLKGQDITQQELGISSREWSELQEVLFN